MKKKNGFIAISIIYSFFLCFTMLMGGMLANYAHTKLIVNKINAPLTLNKEVIKPETDPDNPTDPTNPDDGFGEWKYNECPDGENYLCRIIINKNKELASSKDENQGEYKYSQGLYYLDGDEAKMPSGVRKYYYVDIQPYFDHGLGGKNTINYIYFGNAADYVKFADMYWRILRLNSDGTIRLIYESNTASFSQSGILNQNLSYQNADIPVEDRYKYTIGDDCSQKNPCKSIYDSNYGRFEKNYSGTDSAIKVYLENWYYENIVRKAFDGRTTYSTYCNELKDEANVSGDILIGCNRLYYLNIGLISYDELRFAGITQFDAYMEQRRSLPDGSRVDEIDPYNWKNLLTMTADGTNNLLYLQYNIDSQTTVRYIASIEATDNLYHYTVYSPAIYPVINLRYNVKVSGGNGSLSNPYIIEGGNSKS